MPGGLRDQDRRLFAEELRALRRQRLWSQEDLGTRINFSASTIANIESGYRAPTREQARLFDEVFGTPGTLQRLEGRLRNVPFSAGFRPFQPYEAEARTLKWFEHTLVPGLLQTEEYARAMLSSDPDASEDDTKARLEARMERKLIFERKDPPRLFALLDEHVLHRSMGGPAVMAAQLAALAEAARRPRTTIQVIPGDRPHPGLMGSFAIAELSEPPAIVYLEGAVDGMTVEEPAVAEAHAVLFDMLRAEALSSGDSLSLIEKVAQQWQHRITS
jgi:transcriptional regulator with XRE-family HTH domain